MGELDLYLWPTPPLYRASGHEGKGLLFSVGMGAGNVDYDLRGLAYPYCTYSQGVGRIEESSSFQLQSSLVSISEEVDFILGGDRLQELLPVYQEGFKPLRTVFISDVIGKDIPGGKTLYSIEVISDCEDVVYVGASRRNSLKEPFRFKNWVKIAPYATRARIVTSGVQFKIMLFTCGGGKFEINRLTAWFKLTDRRGFNTFGGQVGNESSPDQGA